MTKNNQDWEVVSHLNYGDHGDVTVIRMEGDNFTVKRLETGAASNLPAERKPIFLGLNDDDKVLLLDPQSKTLSSSSVFPVDAFPAYAYRDVPNSAVWFMNDGDKDTGNDVLNCGDKGSSVTVVKNKPGAAFETTLCVGRGHHVTTFVAPTAALPNLPSRAFVSDLMDGSISVVGNDPNDSATYLKVLYVINLCEPNKEKDATEGVPNNAFPHGMVFSHHTGKLYCLNNGYGTVAIIDPASSTIERRLDLPVSSNLLLSPDGRFIIGKGADRKSDPEHVIGRISVIDLDSLEVVATLDLNDIYPSTYRFSADGRKLYVTTAATGKGSQRDNLKKRSLFVYDASSLPELPLIKETEVGLADCGRRPIAFTSDAAGGFVFVPNPSDGSMSILSADDDTVVDTASIGDSAAKELLFSFWRDGIDGC